MSKGDGLEPVFDRHGDFVGRLKLGHHKKSNGTPWLLIVVVAAIGVAAVFAAGGSGTRAPRSDSTGALPPQSTARP